MQGLSRTALYACVLVAAAGAFTPIEAAGFRRGDSNGDGRVDLSDAVALLLHLFRGGDTVHCQDAADANDNCRIEIADAIWDLAYLFGGGEAPPPPFPATGADPTPDALDCAEYPWPPVAQIVGIKIIYDNYACVPGVQTHWGFSCLVEVDEEQILLDTGHLGSILVSNIAALGIDPLRIRSLFLTHSHYDHVDGLPAFLDLNGSIDAYIPRYFSTVLPSIASSIISHGGTVTYITGPTPICRACESTGELPGVPVEQTLLLRTSEGTVVITGCAHPGIVYTVERAKLQIGAPVYLVMGGFHLFDRSEADVQAIIASFKSLGVRKVAPSHCSGDNTRLLFQQAYGEDYLNAGVGAVFTIGAR